MKCSTTKGRVLPMSITKGETVISRGVLLCLSSRTHKMDEEYTPTESRGGGLVYVDWHCVNCGTVRKDTYNRFSYVLQDRRYYPSAEFMAARELWDHRPTAAEVRALLYGNGKVQGMAQGGRKAGRVTVNG